MLDKRKHHRKSMDAQNITWNIQPSETKHIWTATGEINEFYTNYIDSWHWSRGKIWPLCLNSIERRLSQRKKDVAKMVDMTLTESFLVSAQVLQNNDTYSATLPDTAVCCFQSFRYTWLSLSALWPSNRDQNCRTLFAADDGRSLSQRTTLISLYPAATFNHYWPA